MFSCARKDKRLSSARKRVMSQLGKRSRQGKSSTLPQDSQAQTEEVASLGNETPQSTSDSCLALTVPEVSDLALHESADSVPPSSDSEYFPTPEKRQRVAIMQQPVDVASLGRGIFVCLSSQISALLDQIMFQSE